MGETTTNCRTEEGITVGLIDAMITIARILGPRLQVDTTNNVSQALEDLGSDEDFNTVVIKSGSKTFMSQLEVLRQQLEK